MYFRLIKFKHQNCNLIVFTNKHLLRYPLLLYLISKEKISVCWLQKSDKNDEWEMQNMIEVCLSLLLHMTEHGLSLQGTVWSEQFLMLLLSVSEKTISHRTFVMRIILVVCQRLCRISSLIYKLILRLQNSIQALIRQDGRKILGFDYFLLLLFLYFCFL